MNAPDKIYLQWEEYEGDDVTWCQDKVNDTDVEYVHHDKYEKLLGIAIDSKLIIENLQKLFDVYTTTSLLVEVDRMRKLENVAQYIYDRKDTFPNLNKLGDYLK